MTRTCAAIAITTLLGVSGANAQTIGPDLVNTGFIDVQRYGTDAAGTTTAYAIGSTTCNHGDMPAIVAPAGSTLRPLVAQDMYRLKTDASGAFQRFEQIGQSWVKRVGAPAQGTAATCGSCVTGPSGTMGVGCADIYSSGFNGSQGLLGPRSYINGTTGVWASPTLPSSVGDSVTRGRIQVPTSDVTGQPIGTRFFAVTMMSLPDDAQYVRPGQHVAINAMNNSSTQEVNINAGTASPTLMGALELVPAIVRWQEIDPAVSVVTADHDDTANPGAAFPGTVIRARFYVACRATNIGAGNWRYEFAVYNQNSDRSGGSFTVPLPAPAPISDLTFHAPRSHSGEPYSNDSWTASRSGDTLTFTTASYAANPNANAIRWDTMYNFGFTAPVAPVIGQAQIGLFKPGAGASTLSVDRLLTPQVRHCSADVNNDGVVGADTDIEAFFSCLAGNCCVACESADFNADGDAATDRDIESFFRVLAGGAC